MNDVRSIVLLSGGLDSAVALAWACAEGLKPCALSIDYGQRHRHELIAATGVARSMGVPIRCVPMNLRAVGGSALTDDIEVPKGSMESPLSPGVPITYVPARNLIFLSIAAGLGEVVGARSIVIGVNAVDFSGYPDCRRPFIDAFERAATLGTKLAEAGYSWSVLTPLVSMTKTDIILLGARLGVDLSLTHSCYDPVTLGDEVYACGRCESCRIRRRGFMDAAIADPTRYAP